jgi:hypothetical protein
MSGNLICAVLCHKVIVEESTGNASLIDIIDSIVADVNISEYDEDPIKTDKIFNIPMSMALFSRWTGDQTSDIDLGIDLVGPTGKKILTEELLIPKSTDKQTRVIAKFTSLPAVDGPGEYHFNLKSRSTEKGARWKTATKIPFEVTINTFRKQ